VGNSFVLFEGHVVTKLKIDPFCKTPQKVGVLIRINVYMAADIAMAQVYHVESHLSQDPPSAAPERPPSPPGGTIAPEGSGGWGPSGFVFLEAGNAFRDVVSWTFFNPNVARYHNSMRLSIGRSAECGCEEGGGMLFGRNWPMSGEDRSGCGALFYRRWVQ
jgi:hypothetical protein